MKAKLFTVLVFCSLLTACCSSTNFDVGNVVGANCHGPGCYSSDSYYSSWSSGGGCGSSSCGCGHSYDRCSGIFDNMGGYGSSVCSTCGGDYYEDHHP